MIGNYQGRRLLEVDPNSERAVLAPRRRTEFRRGAMCLISPNGLARWFANTVC
jgi:hypothetical protein